MGIFSNANPWTNTILSKSIKPLDELTIGDEKIDDDGEDFSVDAEADNDDTGEEEDDAEVASEEEVGEPVEADNAEEDSFELPDDGGDETNAEEGPTTESEEDGDQPAEPVDGEESTDDNFEMGENDGEETAPGEDGDQPAEPVDGEESTETPDGETSDIKQAEDQLYDTLTDDQKKIRILQLKLNFQSLYEESDFVLNSINNIPKAEDNIETLRRLIEVINNVKRYILDYLTNSFDSTTYLENNQIYIKFIDTFRTIRKVIDGLSKDQNLNN